MSLRISNTVILKLAPQEYNFIMYIRNKLPYGECQLYTKDGMPYRIEQVLQSVIFDKVVELEFEQKEGTLDI